MNPLFTKVPSALTGLQLLAIACVTPTWGALAIVHAWQAHQRDGRQLWTFGFKLGWFLLLSDGGIYLILSASILREHGSVDLWAAIYIFIGFCFALAAFRSWGQGKANGGLHD
jgi:hypothetical protein